MENSPVTLRTPFTAYSAPIQQPSQVSMIMLVVCYLPVHYVIVAGEPSKLTGVISSSNNTHVNITVSWESPADTVTTGYVIYYQPKTGGPVISESVTGGHRESHSLTGLQRGHTYNISIVALSHNTYPVLWLDQSMSLQVSHSMHVPFFFSYHSLIRSTTGG